MEFDRAHNWEHARISSKVGTVSFWETFCALLCWGVTSINKLTRLSMGTFGCFQFHPTRPCLVEMLLLFLVSVLLCQSVTSKVTVIGHRYGSGCTAEGGEELADEGLF